jgi:hypothetical protein
MLFFLAKEAIDFKALAEKKKTILHLVKTLTCKKTKIYQRFREKRH